MKCGWWRTNLRWPLGAMALLGCLAVGGGALQAEELNLYSARHYPTDEALYTGFTEATGIEINRIEGHGDELLQRILSEGANSPADVLLTVDAGRLYRAEEAGIFQAVESSVLETAIPANLRHPDGLWFGFSTRARMIFYDKSKVSEGEIATYEDLADPKWKGKVCIRESSNVYNQSLLASMIAVHGLEKAKDWAEGVVANFARQPVKGDTNQLRGIGTGECEIAVANSYYFVRLLTEPAPEDEGLAEKIGWVFPNQQDRGTHVNISGAGVLKTAPHPEAAVKFLEYLASPEAQAYFALGNNEYPVVEGVAPNAAVTGLGSFKADEVNVAVYGEHQAEAQRV
ncbi:MAG TPA: Fe(3+) ABC transporter substrate-binding protein, partial [Kiloniellaceae bacterium]|nr:Fe(3+) ABC transporter substrate-binding protein [Kiloniellaceae bacterium]